MLTSSQSKGILFQKDYFDNKKRIHKTNKGYYILPKGFFTYRNRSDNGKFKFNRNDLVDKGIISYFYPVFSVKSFVNSNFFLFSINQTTKKKVYIDSEGTGQHVLSISKLKRISLYLPTLLSEQKNIGNLVTHVEKLITLQQRKIEELNSLKQSINNLILENKSDKISFYKFKGLNWKICQFGQIYQKSNDKNKSANDNLKIISVATMDWGKSIKKSSGEYMKTYNVTKLGDIVFEGHRNKQHEFGRFVENTLGTGLVSHIFDVYRPKNGISDLYFWKFYINSENIMNRVLRMSTSSARMMNNLSNKDLKKQKIMIPEYEEMKDIGSLLLTLQESSNKAQKKLILLRNIRKALLQNLFI